jgi:hypothetical protein
MLLEGTGPYLDLLGCNRNPLYPGYNTTIVAPEPSVERVVGAIHSIGGRIGTLLPLWVPTWDYKVRPWG